MAKLTWDEWNELSAEEKEVRMDEKPDGTDPLAGGYYVDEAGKKRPLKNLIGEVTRKVTEDIRRDLNSNPKPDVRPTGNADILSQIQTRGEEEMVRTGRTFPIETVIDLINRGAYSVAASTQQSMIQANKIRKNAKQELRKKYKDFDTYEDEFDNAVDEVHSSKVTLDGLIFIFKSILGDHVEEREAAAEKRGKESGSGKIIGPADGSGGGKPRDTKSTLTVDQQKEAVEMGFTDEEYLITLKKRQDNAKVQGCTILPQTMSEPLRRPKTV